MPVRMFGIGRLGGQHQARINNAGGKHIAARFQTIRCDGSGTGVRAHHNFRNRYASADDHANKRDATSDEFLPPRILFLRREHTN